jgi:hypothetical protein
VSNAKHYLRMIGVGVALVGALLLPFRRAGAALVFLGAVLVGVAEVLPGPLYGPPPDPASAPVCPECGLRMIFVQYLPDAYQYQCNDHGQHAFDSQGMWRPGVSRASGQHGGAGPDDTSAASCQPSPDD